MNKSRLRAFRRRFGHVLCIMMLCLLAVVSLSLSYAGTPETDPQLETRVMALSHTLRCLVCQNQSIAESNAPLAIDLRNQVREQLGQGKSEREVADYMVARYGDFVLYRPPMRLSTLLLWLGPALLLLAGLGWLAFRLRRNAAQADTELTDSQRRQARLLLDGKTTTEPRS